jgi:hypothetical protein
MKFNILFINGNFKGFICPSLTQNELKDLHTKSMPRQEMMEYVHVLAILF